MAGVTDSCADLLHGRVCSMWYQCGMQFRSNILMHVGAQIPLHAHSYPHMANVRSGKFLMAVTKPGEVPAVSTIQAPALIEIPAWHQHTFTLIEGGQGEVLCFWPEVEA